MMRVPVEVAVSKIHGYGVFARTKIRKGEVVWSYSRIFDHSVAQHVLVRAPKDEQKRLLARGFRNPHSEEIVMCGDEAQWMNFPLLEQEPNVVVSGAIDGFDILIAGSDIEPGEELLVAPDSDLDYTVKMLGYAPVVTGKDKEE